MYRISLARAVLGLLIGLGLLAVACDSPPATEGISPLEPVVGENAPTIVTGPVESDAEMVSLVKQDLAERLGTVPAAIQVLDVAAAEWSDASLGCPLDDHTYAQVQSSGFRITLQSDERVYTYHTGNHVFVLCKEDSGTSISKPGQDAIDRSDLEPEVRALLDKAVENLSTKLGIPGDEIRLDSLEEALWRDSSLGCPSPGQSYLTVITPGYLIKLRVGDEVFEYHTDATGHVVYCQDPTSADPGALGDPAARPAIDRVRNDLAERLGISAAEIEVVSVMAEIWPDAGLGCPQPGKSYVQVVTAGFAIVLKAGEVRYLYHASEDAFALCRSDVIGDDEGIAPPPEESIEDPTLAKLIDEAREDLSAREGIPIEAIGLKSAREVDWRDSSLGCPQAGSAYLTVITPGYLILLEADGESYEYHADQNHVVTCDNPLPPLDG